MWGGFNNVMMPHSDFGPIERPKLPPIAED
jgi:hypothetical protein